MMKRFVLRLMTLSILALWLGAAGCSSATPAPAPLAAMATPANAPFDEAGEMQVLQAAEALPDGPLKGLIAAYSTASAGERQLLVCSVDNLVIPCRRYAVTLKDVQPGLLRVDGEVRSGELTVNRAEALSWDEAGQRAVAEAKLADTLPLLDGYDWSLIALPQYIEPSAWFRPSAAQLTEGGLTLYGYDSVHDKIIWRAQGAEMSKPAPEVFRYPVFYVITDPSGKDAARAIVTIEGRVEE